MKKIIGTFSVITLLSITLISLSQSDSGNGGLTGNGANIAACKGCVQNLITTIKTTVGEIIIGGANNSDISGKVIVVVGVPTERANQLANDYNSCCISNNCSDNPLLVVR